MIFRVFFFPICMTLLLLFQSRLWFVEGNIFDLLQLQTSVESLRESNQNLSNSNAELLYLVQSIQSNNRSLEGYVRYNLNLINPEEEKFYIVVDSEKVLK